MTDERFARQLPFVTAEGQARLERVRIVVVGVGGLGSHVVQQLGYLGARHLVLIDPDRVEPTNLNRLVTATPNDLGSLKVDVLGRFLVALDPMATPTLIPEDLRTRRSFDAVRTADYIVGALDDDGPRFLLNQLSAAYRKPYVDLASELGEDRTSAGGRVLLVRPGEGCLNCYHLLDQREVREWLESPEERRSRERIYGQPRETLTGSGPSVVAVNGVIASLGVVELLSEIAAIPHTGGPRTYRAFNAMVTQPMDCTPNPNACRICSEVVGQEQLAHLERFLASPG